MPTQRITLGKFWNGEDGSPHGTIGALGLNSTYIIGQRAQNKEGQPYFKLIGDPLGAAYEVGVAFPKEKDGMSYYSVVLESPLLPMPINAALFQDANEVNSFNLVWNRPENFRPALDNNPTAVHHRRYVSPTAAP